MTGTPHPAKATRPTGRGVWVSAQTFGVGGLAVLLVLSPLVLPETPAGSETVRAPICRHATHDRLVVREGRDVCGPTLNAGRPVAMGFLPTACPGRDDEYRVDLAGHQDGCLARQPANEGEHEE